MPVSFAQTATAATPRTAAAPILLASARIGLGITVAAFAMRYLAERKLLSGLPPLPPWLPGGPVLALLAGIILLAAAVCLIANLRPRLAAALVGAFLCASALLYLTHPQDVLRNGGVRTGLLEPLFLGAACWLLAWSLAPTPGDALRLPAPLPDVARAVLAISLIIFGVQHFEFLVFVAALIPHWLGAARFWTEFTGAAFVLAGLSIATGVLDRLAGYSLACMFLLWLLILHGPRIAAQPGNGNEWTSGFVALGFLAAGLLVAATGRSSQPRSV